MASFLQNDAADFENYPTTDERDGGSGDSSGSSRPGRTTGALLPIDRGTELGAASTIAAAPFVLPWLGGKVTKPVSDVVSSIDAAKEVENAASSARYHLDLADKLDANASALEGVDALASEKYRLAEEKAIRDSKTGVDTLAAQRAADINAAVAPRLDSLKAYMDVLEDARRGSVGASFPLDGPIGDVNAAYTFMDPALEDARVALAIGDPDRFRELSEGHKAKLEDTGAGRKTAYGVDSDILTRFDDAVRRADAAARFWSARPGYGVGYGSDVFDPYTGSVTGLRLKPEIVDKFARRGTPDRVGSSGAAGFNAGLAMKYFGIPTLEPLPAPSGTGKAPPAPATDQFGQTAAALRDLAKGERHKAAPPAWISGGGSKPPTTETSESKNSKKEGKGQGKGKKIRKAQVGGVVGGGLIGLDALIGKGLDSLLRYRRYKND